jgi:parallel beta-helix repeat protein
MMRDFWGDGISMGARDVNSDGVPDFSEDVFLSGLQVMNVRRNGLSIGRARNIVVVDSRFEETNGTSPECGIDVEADYPDAGGYVDDVLIQRCLMRGNKKYGINLFKQSRRVRLIDNDIEGNAYGIVTVDASDTEIFGNRVYSQSNVGIFLQNNTQRTHIAENTFYGNTRMSPRTRTPRFGLVGADIKRDILTESTVSGTSVGRNYYE